MLHNRDSLFTQIQQIFISYLFIYLFIYCFLQNQGVQNLNGMFEAHTIIIFVTV